MTSAPDLTPLEPDQERSVRDRVDALYAVDATARAHGIRIESATAGRVELSMLVRADMANGAGVAHGAWAFSLADTAFAYAAATVIDGVLTTGADIRFHRPAAVGSLLRAVATIVERHRSSVMVDVTVRGDYGQRIASFRADGRAPRAGTQAPSS